MNRAYVELRDLEPGMRFRFAAPDLPHPGPCTLVEKTIGRAKIRYDVPRAIATRTFEARDEQGQKVQRTITLQRPDLEPCALGAQVILLDAVGQDVPPKVEERNGALIAEGTRPRGRGWATDGLRGPNV